MFFVHGIFLRNAEIVRFSANKSSLLSIACAKNKKSLENTGLSITHVNLLDRTVEGLECVKDKVFSVQYHPESSPGPQDSFYLFDRFINMMRERKDNA